VTVATLDTDTTVHALSGEPIATIVMPMTLLAWHRKLIAQTYDGTADRCERRRMPLRPGRCRNLIQPEPKLLHRCLGQKAAHCKRIVMLNGYNEPSRIVEPIFPAFGL